MDPSSTAEIAWHRVQGYTPELCKHRNTQIGISTTRTWSMQSNCMLLLSGASVKIRGTERRTRLEFNKDTVELPRLLRPRTQFHTVPADLSARLAHHEYAAMSDGRLHSTLCIDCNTCVHDVSWFLSTDGPVLYSMRRGERTFVRRIRRAPCVCRQKHEPRMGRAKDDPRRSQRAQDATLDSADGASARWRT